jgi:chemotaxis protein methyltransferase CheR
VIASDADQTMLERARVGCYGRCSLKDLPAAWRERAFERRDALLCLVAEFRRGVEFLFQDIREAMPEGPFDLVLCRNLAFTYFDTALQRRVLDRLRERIGIGGFLVFGSREALPPDGTGFAQICANLPIYRRLAKSPG